MHKTEKNNHKEGFKHLNCGAPLNLKEPIFPEEIIPTSRVTMKAVKPEQNCELFLPCHALIDRMARTFQHRWSEFVCLFVWLVGFLTSSSTTRLYRERAPRQSE